MHDPSTPLSGGSATEFTDIGAIGIVFNLQAGQMATVTYLSRSNGASNLFRTRFFKPESELGSAKGVNVEYRDVAPGAIEGRFTLKRSDAADYFAFVLMAALGHGAYV